MQDRLQDLQRVVGFYEYVQALHHFEQLFRAVTDDELQAMDEIVQQRPELTVYSGLSLHFNEAANSPLAKAWNTENDRGRRGIHWLSALARLEVAAMISGHLPRRASIPRDLLPKPAERSAYSELLRDAILFHASSIEADANRAAGRTMTRADALMYERRIMQAERITQLLYQLERKHLSRTELTELGSIQKRLTRIGQSVRGSLAFGSR